MFERSFDALLEMMKGDIADGRYDVKELTATGESGEDYRLYGMIEEFDKVILTKGSFAIIYPNEPHAPALAAGDPLRVRKAAIKVKA